MNATLMEYVELLVAEDLFATLTDPVNAVLDFIWTPVLLFCASICVAYRYLVSWKIQKPHPPSNQAVLFGQLLLASSLYFCFQSIHHFHDSSFFRSFILCSVSCCLNSFSMLVSYDFRNPPNQKLGLLLTAVGTVANLCSSFHIYDSRWSHVAHIPYIMGLHTFVVGATIMCMHMLNAVYEASFVRVKTD